jgi:hypothetical protein
MPLTFTARRYRYGIAEVGQDGFESYHVCALGMDVLKVANLWELVRWGCG